MRVKIFLFILTAFITGCSSELSSSAKKEQILQSTTDPAVIHVLFSDNNDSLINIIINQPPVEYCGITHHHFVDIVAKGKVDSLKNDGVKDILYYRDWLGTNGFNGYGKLIWLQNGKCNQYQFNFENSNGRYGISSIDKSVQDNCEVLDFYHEKQIDTVLSSPKKSNIGMSHAADHFIYVFLNGRENCFNVSGLDLSEDSMHLKSQLINKLNIPSSEYLDMIQDREKKSKI